MGASAPFLRRLRSNRGFARGTRPASSCVRVWGAQKRLRHSLPGTVLYCRRVEFCTGKKTPGGAGKKTPGGAGTHTGHTGTRITQTNLTTIQTHQPTAVRSRPTHRGAWPAQKDTGGSRDTTVTPTPHTTTVKRSDCPSAKQRAVGKARCLLVIKGEWSATPRHYSFCFSSRMFEGPIANPRTRSRKILSYLFGN